MYRAKHRGKARYKVFEPGMGLNHELSIDEAFADVAYAASEGWLALLKY